VRIQIAYADAAHEFLVTLDVAEGCRVEDAVAQSELLARIGAPRDTLGYAIFGRRVDASAMLSADDRVEITRPLRCDAKTARRERATRDK
jgi:putative ubiquitin-RnfH superfamily antitoxin RatB of RatAB toxin-antitoxin module